MRWRALALLGLLLGAGGPLPAAPKPAERLAAALRSPALAHGLWGFEVRSLRTGRVLHGHEAGLNLRPASTLKLLTTAAALDAFGPDHRHITTVQAAAPLDASGVLGGDLYLVGGGDPNLSARLAEGRITAAFERLADALVAAGVRRVEGGVIGHEGLFSGPRRGADWAWEDLVWWYGAEVSALSFNDNVAHLTASPGARAGEPIGLVTAPRTSYFEVVTTAITGPPGSPSTLTLERDLDATRIRLSGSMPAGTPRAELSVALPDPARYAATVFRETLVARGIEVAGGIDTSSEPLPSGARILARHEGAPLSEVIAVVNKKSQNLHAELLLRLLGTRDGDGSAEAGVRAMEAFAKEHGIELGQAELRDGSGLSRSNLLPATVLTQLLAVMASHEHAAVFRASLAVAGVDGTLRSRLKGTPAEGRLAAKTGTLEHVHALAGYAQTGAGEPVAFAVIGNNHNPPAGEVTAAIDAFVRALVSLR